MDCRPLRPAQLRDFQPLEGDVGPPPPSTSGATLGAPSCVRKMQHSSRSSQAAPEDKPLTHPQKWALTLLAARASLGNALLPLAVRLPSSAIDENEWLACQVYDIFNESNVVWSFVREVCHCRRLTAGDFSLVAPAEPSAPAREHIRTALSKCRTILQDPRIFVSRQGQDFPRNFPSFVSHILVQLLQMYCHIYRQHFDWLLETDTVAHVNCCFKHALYFGTEFRLVKLDDVAPVKGLALHFLEQAQREIAEADAADGKPPHQHPQQHQQLQQPRRQQQPQQDAGTLQQQKGPQPSSGVSVRRPA